MRILYKYQGPDRTDVLRDGRIRYTQPLEFNDPFESKPHVAGMPPREMMERVSLVEQKRMDIPEDDRLAILKLGEDPEHARTVQGFMLALMGSMVGVLSLTEKPDNLLMWAHYAAEHTGFVIGFDTTHDYWNHFANEEKTHAGLLRKVTYSERRPSLPHLAEMSMVEMYFTKSLQWEYEQEWRTFRTCENPDHVIECGEGHDPVYLFNFPKDSVSEVVLGCRSSQALEQSVVEILRGSPGYASTVLLRAETDEVEFKLNVRKIWPGDNQ